MGDKPAPTVPATLPLLTRLRHGIVGTALVSVAWFGGGGLLIAGSPIWAAVVATIGGVAFWRWRQQIRRQLDLLPPPPEPPVPEARLLASTTFRARESVEPESE